MKKNNWLALILIGVSAAAMVGYSLWDRVVTDRNAPEITVEEQILQTSVFGDEAALLQGITVMDDRDGDVTDSLIVESVGAITADGQATVRYAAFDRSGNVAKTTRIVQYTDYTGPRFVLKAPLLFAAGSGFEAVDVVGAVDVLDGDISYRVRATSQTEQSLSEVGCYPVQFRVTNSLGDTRKLTLTVELEAAGSRNADLQLNEYLVYLSAGSRFDAMSYLKSFRYSATNVPLYGSVPEGFQLSMEGTVDTGTPGVYEVKYTVSHSRGDQTYTGTSRIVVIVEE